MNLLLVSSQNFMNIQKHNGLGSLHQLHDAAQHGRTIIYQRGLYREAPRWCRVFCPSKSCYDKQPGDTFLGPSAFVSPRQSPQHATVRPKYILSLNSHTILTFFLVFAFVR